MTPPEDFSTLCEVPVSDDVPPQVCRWSSELWLWAQASGQDSLKTRVEKRLGCGRL